jgi:hypothetical protein
VFYGSKHLNEPMAAAGYGNTKEKPPRNAAASDGLCGC